MNSGAFWVANSSHTRTEFLEFAKQFMEENPYTCWEWVAGKPRTGKQNAALHVFCRMLAEKMNEGGITQRKFFKDGLEVPWSTEMVKENIWKPMQEAVVKHESSTDCNTTDYSKVYDQLNVKLIEHGLSLPWPEKPK